ncbi:MAG: DUF389 domain-containing protein [Tenacibaculum sp.]|nr:DUF389 domain-containing protein [Tenacibaculum sp.]
MEENKEPEVSAVQVKEEAKDFFQSLKIFLKELLDFRHDTDHQATMEAIKGDIPFKGATAWILIFAVFVASIGLNANSTAVVIGAMLISPLMGPILGIGMAFAVNDIDTFKKSAISLITMIILSLLTSFIFFYFFPLSEDTSELMGRTKPDIRDVLIAFFGGLSLMVARTKKGTVASVIFGVAIATALMPPLCTVGYGLSKWASGSSEGFWNALGAMYLFTINTIFIALATFIVLKLLRFPMYKYANSTQRKRYAFFATILGIGAMIPAIYTFFITLDENRVNQQISSYISNEIKVNKSLQLMNYEVNLSNKTLSLNFFNEINDATKNDLLNELTNNPEYPKLEDFKLEIKGSDTKSYELISSAYKDAREELKSSKNIIEGLNKEIEYLKNEIAILNDRIEQDALNKNKTTIAFSSIAKDAKIRYNTIKSISFANTLNTKDFIKFDTVPEVNIQWDAKLPDSIRVKKEIEIRQWLQNNMNLDTLFIVKKH